MCPPGCPAWWHHLNPIKFAIGRAFAPSVTTRSRPRLERHTRRRERRTRSPPPTSISDDLQLTTIAIFYTDIRLDSGNSLYYNISTITSYCIYSSDINLKTTSTKILLLRRPSGNSYNHYFYFSDKNMKMFLLKYFHSTASTSPKSISELLLLQYSTQTSMLRYLGKAIRLLQFFVPTLVAFDLLNCCPIK